jgi:hypothetical protein
MMSDSNNNIERLDNSIEKFNTNNSNDLAEIKKSIQDLKVVMDNTRKEPTDMKQTLHQLMSKIETVERENILLRSQAQLTKISGAKQTFQENASHTCEAKSDTRKAKPQVLLLGTSNVIGIRQDKLTTAADVTKVVRYTIKDTIEYIRSCSMSPDLIACHSLTNDLTKIPPDRCRNSCICHLQKMGLDQNYYFPMHTPTR